MNFSSEPDDHDLGSGERLTLRRSGETFAAMRQDRGLSQADMAMAVMHGRRTRDRRRSAGFSIDETTRAVSLHPNALRNFEHGVAAPSVLNACRIYRFLGVPSVDGSGFPGN